MARLRIGDRVYHRTRQEHGTYEGRASDPAVCWVMFDGQPEADRVSKHLVEPAVKRAPAQSSKG